MAKNKPTEQQLFCITSAENNRVTKIIACAGGGKTSTLEMIATKIVESSLYAAFNKTTATEAEERFPPHVTCQTTHSIAYAAFGRQLVNKLSRPKGKYVNVAGTGSEIAKYYKLCGVDVAGECIATPNAIGVYVKRTVERFEQSADMRMTIKNVPAYDMEKIIAADRNVTGYVLKAAQKLWKDRIDIKSPVLATHDTYLKLFQLSKPILPYDVIYCDEWQDATPCVSDIILSQPQTTKLIAVGDPRQAIYGWRGAVNALEHVEGIEAPLSMSFRYGKGIAKVATAVLAMDMIIDGREDLESIVGYNKVDRTKPYMYLFRTNAALLDEAVMAIDGGEKIKMEVDTKDFVKLLQSAQALYDGYHKNIKHEKILPYSKWKALVEEAKEIGGELKRVQAIVEGGRSEHIISVLEHYVAPPDALATYTTTHKAKGREADQVILADDFPSHYSKDGEWKPLPEAEQNLLYVAVTRSQRVLEINKSVAEVMDKYKIDLDTPGWYDTDFIEDEYPEMMPQPEIRMNNFVGSMLKDHIRQETLEVNRIIYGD